MKYALAALYISCIGAGHSAARDLVVLDADDYRHYAEKFRANDEELVVNHIPNAQAWRWLETNIPFFECPSTTIEEIYYFRWWSFRKHIKQTPHGLILTEFLQPVSHAGQYNTIACAVGHHLAEARWLLDQRLLQDYCRFWFASGDGGGPASHFHKFSSWVAAALYESYLVTGERDFCVELLNPLVRDYEVWSQERQLPSGLYWQHDVKDGMEESISGGRHVQNIRPTINSYMAANARAISEIAALAGKTDLSAEYERKHRDLRQKLNATLWDPNAQFFKVVNEQGEFSDAREAIGYIPWMFALANSDQLSAWHQIKDREGFWAPAGITTAERRHSQFRSHGVGTCEWDGAVWPFATSQTLRGMAEVLRTYEQKIISKRDYFEQLLRYSKSHEMHGIAYIGEYHDEITGDWLITGPKAERSRYYNHSTYADLIISGLVGLVPRADTVVEVSPLLPENSWSWFCLDGISYRGHTLTILWDEKGDRYGFGRGLTLLVDGKLARQVPALERLTFELSE